MDSFRVALVLAVCIFAVSSEPQCSKFAYEEQTLDKMIRTEIKCEQLNQNVQQALHDFKVSFTELEQNVDHAVKEIQHALEVNKADSTNIKVDFDKQMDETKDIIRNHETRIDGMLQDLQNFQNVIYNNISGLVNTPTIAFNARDVSDLSPSNGQTVVFTTTLVNVGRAYDNTSGVFTAPIDGFYSFSAQLCTTNRKYVTASILVESIEYGRGFIRDYDDHSCNSFSALAFMKKGNTAKIQIKYTDGDIYKNDHLACFFSGFLVK